MNTTLRLAMRSGASGLVLAAAIGAATNANAQQALPGQDARCVITNGVAVCSGDLKDGVRYYDPLPDVTEVRIENVTTPIAPPGYFGIGYDVSNLPIKLVVQDGVIINTFDSPSIVNPAQGIVAISQNGNSIDIDTGAIVTVNANGQVDSAVEASANGGAASIALVNRGAVAITNSAQEASAIRAGLNNSTGTVNITNSGALTAVSGGTGERDYVTAGIVVTGGTKGTGFTVNNSGAIAITTGANTFDTDFLGYASGIIVNANAPTSTTSITNTGAITGTGPNTTALLGFATNNDAANASTITLTNSGTVALSQVFDSNVLLAQTQGLSANTIIVNSGDLTATAVRNISNAELVTFMQTLNATKAANVSVTNTGDLAASGDAQVLVRGIGLTASGAGTANGTYDLKVDNTGAMNFGTAASQGITLYATRGDIVTASIVNSGDFDFTATATGQSQLGNSEGIRATFGALDAAETATGMSTLTITNSGNIALGAGNALIATATASTIANTGDLSTTADGAHVVLIAGSPAGTGSPATSLAFTNSGDISATGAGADAISLADINALSFSLASGALVQSGSGAGTAGVRLGGTLGTATLDIQGTVRSAGGTGILIGTSGVLNASLGATGVLDAAAGFALDSGAKTTLNLAAGATVKGDIRLSALDDVVTLGAANIDGDLLTGAGNDKVTFANLAITGMIDLGDGDDMLDVSGAFNTFGTIVGGAGNDQVRYTTVAGQAGSADLTGRTINGFELFIQDGTGSVTYTGTNAFATRYELRGGSLVQNASLANVDLVTMAGTTLALGAPVKSLAASGTVGLGSAIPVTRTIAGDVSFAAGSTYIVNLTPTAADRITAGGKVTLAGGTVDVKAAAGNFVPGDTFVILSGAGGVTGTFTGLSTASTAFLNLSLTYSANQVLLALAAATPPTNPPTTPPTTPALDFTPFALTFNERAASGPLPGFALTAGSDTRTVYSEFLFLQTGQVAPALDAISGEIHASLLASTLRLAAALPATMADRARAPVNVAGIGGFVSGYYAASNLDADGNAAKARYTRAGLSVGADWNDPASALRVGIAGGWSSGEVELDARRSKAEQDAWHLGAYVRAGSFAAGFSAMASAAYSKGDADVTRSIAFGGIARTATSSYSLDGVAVEGEARYGLPLGNGIAAGPVATIAYVRINRDGFAERGASSLDLIGADDDADRTNYGIGGFAALSSAGVLFDLAVLYDHAGSDPVATSLAYEGLPGSRFTVLSPDGAGDGVALRASAEVDLGGAWHLGASYRGRYGEGESNSAGFLTLSLR